MMAGTCRRAALKAQMKLANGLDKAVSKRFYNVIVRGRPEDELAELDASVEHGHISKFIMQRFADVELKDQVALIDGNTAAKLTFGEAHRQTYSLAAQLKKLLGIGKGHVVALMSPNNINYFSCLVGVPLTGAASTTINPFYTKDEVAFQLELTESKVIIAHPSCMDIAEAAAKEAGIPVLNIEHLDEFLSVKECSLDYDSFGHDFNPDEDLVTIPFSSGTTGTAKGVMLTHRNLTSNVLQVKPGESRFLNEGNTRSGKRGVLMCPLPYYHIYGLVAGLLVPMHAGAKTVFLSKFDLRLFLSLIQEHQVTRALVVPPIVLSLSKEPFVDDYDLSSLETLMSAAAPLGGEIQKATALRLNAVLKQAWGLTELSPFSSITPDDHLRPSGFSPDLGVQNIDLIIGKSGRLTPSTEGKIINPETGKDLRSTDEGEVLIRGPQVMKGYLKNPEATAATITPDGWLKTGDIGHFTDDGWIVITDRNKELIKFSGFQVAPAELEAILLTMPAVKDTIVIPVLDEKHGEIPRAYIVQNADYLKAGGGNISEEQVVDYVASRVSPHKKLRGGVQFVDEIPKSPSGKLLRRVMIKIDRGEA